MEAFRRLTVLFPEYREGQIFLAAALSDAGRTGEARYWYAKALRLYGRFAEARAVLEPLLAPTGKKVVADELRDLDTLPRGAVRGGE